MLTLHSESEFSNIEIIKKYEYVKNLSDYR